MRRVWPLAFFALLPLLPLWRAVFLGQAIGPFDQIRQMQPWNGPKPGQPWDVLQADAVLEFYPWRDLVLEAWGKGQLPLWNPYQLAGTPLLANSQSGGLYPLHILLGVWHVPTSVAVTLLAWFHLFWAGLGVYVLCRRFGACSLGAFTGGAAFATSAFLLAWTPLGSVVTTVAWVPWALAAVHGTASGSARSAPVLALSVAMMLLAGHLQFAAYGLLAILVIGGFALSSNSGDEIRGWRERSRAALAIFLAVAVGALLAAPQLRTVLAYSEFSHRRNTPTEEGYQAYVYGSLRPFELATAAFPSLQGNPTIPSEAEPRLSTFWPALAKRGSNFAESAIGFGPIVLFGLVFLLGRRIRIGYEGAWLALASLALLVCLGTPINRLLYFFVPGWSSTGSPGRIAVLVLLSACVLGALGVTRAFEPMRKRSREGFLLVALGVVASNVVLNEFASRNVSPWIEGADPGLLHALAVEASRSAAPVVLALSALALAAFWIAGSRPRVAGGLALVSSALGAFAMLGPGFVRTGSPDLTFEAGVRKHERIAVVNQPWDLLLAVPAALPPNTATLARVHDLGGYDSLLHRETVAMLHEVVGQDPAPPANGNIMFVKPSFDPSKIVECGVTEVWSPVRLEGLRLIAGEPTEGPGGLLRYRLPGPGRASVDGRPAQIVEEGYDRLTVRATGPGTLVVRDRNMPGWTAKIGDRQAELIGDRWLEVRLPAGEHEVRFLYRPYGLDFRPFALGLMGLFAMLLSPALGQKRSREA